MPPAKLTIHPLDSQIVIEGKLLEVTRYQVTDADRTIVLLHEALGSVSHWKDFPARMALRTNHNVMLYSRAGHGESDGPPERRSLEYFKRQAETVLFELLGTLQITNPILFGHSEGASIAALFASHHTAIPRAIILESPILTIEDATTAGLQSAIDSYHVSDLRSRLARYHRDPDSVFRSWTEPWVKQEIQNLNSDPILRAIVCPICAIQGDRDEFATRKQMSILSQSAPNAHTFIIEDCGHTPHREKPDAVLDCLSTFFHSARL